MHHRVSVYGTQMEKMRFSRLPIQLDSFPKFMYGSIQKKAK